MDSLLFSFNATVPVFLMMVLGMLLRKLGWMSEEFASQFNRFVFMLPLPVLLFQDLATVDFLEVWNFSFVAFCFVVTLISILIAMIISKFLKDKSIQGEFIQATYRSSAALLGVALIQNIYGSSTMGPLMIIGSVPLYNIFAVIILSFYQPHGDGVNRDLLKKTCLGILKNPIIIGIAVGFLWSLCSLPMPTILSKSVSYVANMATPLGLIAMGASFRLDKAISQIKPAFLASFFKLFGFCFLFLPLAIILGFRQEQLIAILVMLGSASTVTCYVMAKNMGHAGVLSSNVVMLTTLLSGFSLTFWIWVLRVLSFI